MLWLFWFTFFSILSEGNSFMSYRPEAKIIDMKAQAKLIQEAREARAKRKAERAVTCICAGMDRCVGPPNCTNPQFPGGIDDMGV